MRRDDGGPGNDISKGHSVEQVEGPVQLAAFGVGVEERVGDEEVRVESGLEEGSVGGRGEVEVSLGGGEADEADRGCGVEEDVAWVGEIWEKRKRRVDRWKGREHLVRCRRRRWFLLRAAESSMRVRSFFEPDGSTVTDEEK